MVYEKKKHNLLRCLSTTGKVLFKQYCGHIVNTTLFTNIIFMKNIKIFDINKPWKEHVCLPLSYSFGVLHIHKKIAWTNIMFYIIVWFDMVRVILFSFMLLIKLVTKQSFHNDFFSVFFKVFIALFPTYNICQILLQQLAEKSTTENIYIYNDTIYATIMIPSFIMIPLTIKIVSCGNPGVKTQAYKKKIWKIFQKLLVSSNIFFIIYIVIKILVSLKYTELFKNAIRSKGRKY